MRELCEANTAGVTPEPRQRQKTVDERIAPLLAALDDPEMSEAGKDYRKRLIKRITGGQMFAEA